MEGHLSASHRVIPDNTLFIEPVGPELSGTIAINSIITLFKRDVKRFFRFLYLDYIKLLNHFFRQKTFSQLYIWVLFHRNLF